MNFLVNFADKNYKSAQKINTESAYKTGGFDKVTSYSPNDIGRDFYLKNEKLLKKTRGAGYWLWKPYFILKMLESIGDGDRLMYCDSDARFIHSAMPLIKLIDDHNRDIISFATVYPEKHYTKRDAFLITGLDNEPYINSRQVLSGYMVYRKTKFTIGFLKEFLEFMQDPRMSTDMNNTLGEPNYAGFVEHRHDQSVFSLLIKKYGLKSFRDPSQWGNSQTGDFPESNYPQIIELTTNRDLSVKWKLNRVKLRLMRLFNK